MTSRWSSSARALVLSLLLLAFIIGVSAGVAGDRLLTPRARLIIQSDMSAVLDRLDLTDVQRRQADSIISRRAPLSRAIMLETAERLRAVADSVDRELRDVLTADQRSRLDSLRTGARIMLKTKTPGSEGFRIDTLLDTSTSTLPRK